MLSCVGPQWNTANQNSDIDFGPWFDRTYQDLIEKAVSPVNRRELEPCMRHESSLPAMSSALSLPFVEIRT